MRYDATDKDSLVEGILKWAKRYGQYVVNLHISYV